MDSVASFVCRKYRLTWFLFGIVLCGGGCNKNSSSDKAAPSFAWPSPSRFQVEERIQKGRSQAVILHTFDFSPTNGGHVLRWVGAEHLSINGRPISSDEEKASVSAANQLYLANPPMLIGTNGEFLGAIDVDVERSLDQMDATLDKINPSRTNSDAPRFKKVFTDPESRAIYDRVLSQYWTTWVGAWVGWNVPHKQAVTNDVEIPDESGRPLTTLLIQEHLGKATNNPAHIQLFYEEFVTGKQFAASIEAMLSKADEKWQSGKTNERVRVKEATRAIYYEVITDPHTLKPSWAKRTQRVKAEVVGETATRQQEIREYHFFWNQTNLHSAPTQ